MKNNDVTYMIIGCAYRVHNELGRGFLENVYKNALCVQLEENGYSVEKEVKMTVSYHGREVGVYFADIIVNGIVVIETKVSERITMPHIFQVRNYLAVSGLDTGILINFHPAQLDHRRVFPARE